MAYGICKKCKREVTAGSDRCALCGEPLPLLGSPHPTVRLPAIPVDRGGQGDLVQGKDPQRPIVGLVNPSASSMSTGKPARPVDPRMTLTMDELVDAAVLRKNTAMQAKTAGGGFEVAAGAIDAPLADDRGSKPVPSPFVGEEIDSFDMKRLLAQTEPPVEQSLGEQVKSPTVELPSVSRPLFETNIEGFGAVGKKRRMSGHTEDQRRHSLLRTLPLLGVLLLVLAGLALAGSLINPGGGNRLTEGEQDAPMVRLAAGQYLVGLSEDNKETVLQACFRLSDNPNHECRRSYLTDIGEYPAELVDFPAVRIDRYEVSNARYQACVESGACRPVDLDSCQFHTHRGYQLNTPVPERMLGPDMPAICITRDEAESYCRWAGGQLPTPEQWERAARGGDDRLAPWGTLWASNLLNWAESDMGGFPVSGRLDGYDLTAPVDRFPDGATPDGLYNMLGNVAEWVAPSERYRDGTRGGSYRDDLRDLRITYQRPLQPTARRSDVGFRCLVPVEEER
ncbi:MAG: SUMF1/EgtB/PvdO family nonheme iron enzyme [Bradymonadales bacterium]|nr:SUMF1/EgtB/PvdO family nonheme iron enzyme [Bradymonadales bacterium]